LATAAPVLHSLPSAPTSPGVGAIGLTGSLAGFFTGMPSVYLGVHDLAAPDYLSRFRAHAGITAVLASAGFVFPERAYGVARQG
jgi:hypothetical protein